MYDATVEPHALKGMTSSLLYAETWQGPNLNRKPRPSRMALNPAARSIEEILLQRTAAAAVAALNAQAQEGRPATGEKRAQLMHLTHLSGVKEALPRATSAPGLSRAQAQADSWLRQLPATSATMRSMNRPATAHQQMRARPRHHGGAARPGSAFVSDPPSRSSSQAALLPHTAARPHPHAASVASMAAAFSEAGERSRQDPGSCSSALPDDERTAELREQVERLTDQLNRIEGVTKQAARLVAAPPPAWPPPPSAPPPTTSPGRLGRLLRPVAGRLGRAERGSRDAPAAAADQRGVHDLAAAEAGALLRHLRRARAPPRHHVPHGAAEAAVQLASNAVGPV